MIYQTFQLGKDTQLVAMIHDPYVSYQVTRKRGALILCPGGAYLIHATKEGEMSATHFYGKDWNTFVLKYTVAMDREHPEKGFNKDARYPLQVIELMEAVHFIKQHAEEWYIDIEQMYVMGFSAGGHVAASLGTRWNDPALTSKLSFKPQKNELKLSGMILGYPMLRDNSPEFYRQDQTDTSKEQNKLVCQVLYGKEEPSKQDRDKVNLINYISRNTIPTFIWHSTDDRVVDHLNSIHFIRALDEAGINCEFHLFSRGGHGLALANDITAANNKEKDIGIALWSNLALEWIHSLREAQQ